MKHLIITFLILLTIHLEAQENRTKNNSFSLEQAIAYGLLHNYDYINTQTDVKIAKKMVMETTAIGLPQINASISNTNYIDIPTTLMPDFISPAVYGVNQDNFGLIPLVPLGDEIGTFPVKFGTKYNASADISISQLVFSGEYIIGLQAAKTFLLQTAQMQIKTKQNLKEQISKSYYLALSLRKQKMILEKTLKTNEKLLAETRQLFQNGFAEDTDVAQLEIIYNNLSANVQHLNNESVTALNYLKLSMGMPLSESLELTDSLETLMESSIVSSLGNFLLEHNIDFQMINTQMDLAKLQLKREQSAYLPQLSAFFNAQTNAMRNEFNFFDSSETWFPTTVYGFNLNIPIWSSGSRYSKVQQAKLKYNKLEESVKQLSNVLRLEVQTAENNFQLHLQEYQNSVNNLALSEKIYEKTQTKYKEGLASSFDLIQAHNYFLNASGNYTSSILNILNDKSLLNRLYYRTENSK